MGYAGRYLCATGAIDIGTGIDISTPIGAGIGIDIISGS